MARHVKRLTDADIGRRKATVEDVVAPDQPPFQRAVAFFQPLRLDPHHGGAAHRVVVKRDMLLGQRGGVLADGFGEMDPDQPVGALLLPRRAAKPRLGETLAEIFGDRPAFPDHPPVDFQRRNPARGVQRKVVERAERLVERVDGQIEANPKLVQKPERAHGAGLVAMVQADHASSSSSRTSAAPASTC